MAGAYLIDLTAARNMLAYLHTHKCAEVIDWWHNTLIKEGIVTMYWAHPPLVEQGSHNGRLNASISSKPQSTLRVVSWQVQKFYKVTIRRFFGQKAILDE